MSARRFSASAVSTSSMRGVIDAGPRSAGPGRGFGAMILAMWQARRTRRMLTEMDSHLLADIGVGHGDAMMEASRPFWDLAPRHR